MKINEKNYWKIAVIIAIIAIVFSVSGFLLKEIKNEEAYTLPATICLGIAVFALVYSALFFAIQEDEKNKENLDQNKKDDDCFNPDSYPRF